MQGQIASSVVKAAVAAGCILLACKKNEYNPRLVQYLKAEKELRCRIQDKHGLADSIQILQDEYRIDIEKELEKLDRNPEAWIKLIQELESGE